MQKAKAVVRLAQIEIPPTRVFQKTIEDALTGRYNPIVEIEEDARQWDGVGLSKSIEGTVQTAFDILHTTPDALFAAYIMPTAVLGHDPETGLQEHLTMIFIAVRSSHGNEWFYVDMGDNVPPEVIGIVAPTMDAVLEKRQALCNPISKEHYAEAECFIQGLRAGLNNAFIIASQRCRTLQ